MPAVTKEGHWRVITPKKNPFADLPGMTGRVALALSAFGHHAQAEISFYPQAETAYKRTGTLGRRWTTKGPRFSGGAMTMRVGNNTVYARKVQGPRQEARFKELGWRTSRDVIVLIWPAHRAALIKAIQG